MAVVNIKSDNICELIKTVLGISWIVITNELINEIRNICVKRVVYLIMDGL
jgi:hypothetical protein